MKLRPVASLPEARDGVVGPMLAVLGVSLLAAAGLALDVALYYVGERDLRAATEAAALAASMNPGNAEERARDYLTRNGYDGDVLQSVEVGRYCPDVSVDPNQRFDPSFTRCPGNGVANAVRLHTKRASRRFLTGVFDEAVIPDMEVTASAARIDEAGIGITSGLLTVTNPLVNVVNDLLGALLGIKLRLNQSDIEGMMGANVDAGLFFDALAKRSGSTGTYGDLVAGTYGIKDIVMSAADATSNIAAKLGLHSLGSQVTNSYQVPLSDLFGLGVWKNMPVGHADSPPSLRAGINAYQLVTFAIQAGPGVIDLSDAVSLAVPGSIVKIGAIATGPADRPRFSFGPAGETSVGTSLLRLQILLGLGDINLLGFPISESVPVLIDVAAAHAEISQIECTDTAEQGRDTRVNVTASSGLVNAYIGKAPANALTRPVPPITADDISQVRLLNVLNLVTVDARAVAQPVFGKSSTLTFGPGGNGTIGSPDSPGSPASVGNGAQVGPLISSLVDGLMAPDGLQIELLGLCLPIVCQGSEDTLRQTLLGAITTPLSGLVGNTADPLLDFVLEALGIQLGHATVWATGARCGVPVLI
ncbi:pilus assembly protein TadG-related protein [Novosphingobium sp. PP1Y]|uniref:pilus assembly protein TadG-related protein n=1 Tax=Novosphingobium sp. PP1Y TaxID=702113 RepID=UPI0002D81D74|nr:pilus assembly protein TadG-related protein [Novosphingobium sp. PP1Y]